jgi:hypothetical protein
MGSWWIYMHEKDEITKLGENIMFGIGDCFAASCTVVFISITMRMLCDKRIC